jgi:Zn-dependent protease with chaperone function
VEARDLVTRLLSTLLVIIGVVMVVSTLARGGGPLASGVVLGLLFAAAGVARLYVSLRSEG